MAPDGAHDRPVRLVSLGLLVAAALVLSACHAATGGSDRTDIAGKADQTVRTVAGGPVIRQRIPLAVRRTVLHDQDGRRVSLASLHGRTVVLAPAMTLCQETCPMTSALIRQAAQDFRRTGRSGRVVFVELTVDPWRDTVARLHAYRRLYGPLPDWTLLTGRPHQVAQVWKALGVSMIRVHGHDRVRDWMTGKLLPHPYDVRHQDVVFIIDSTGWLRWIRLGRPDARAGPLPATLSRFLNAEGHQNYRAPGADAWTAADVEQALLHVDALADGH